MKRLRIAVVAVGLLALSATGTVMAADEDVLPNPGTPDTAHNGNCIAFYSAAVIHNGAASTLGQNAAQGARGTEIKNLQQTTCPPAAGQ